MPSQATYPSCQLPRHQMSTFAWENFRQNASTPQFEPSTWVKLLNPPTAFSFDEAWLLCQYSADAWLAWVPDYGEILLTTDEFCSLP
jgi:hypothetical protein